MGQGGQNPAAKIQISFNYIMKLAKICLDPLSNSNNRRTPPLPPPVKFSGSAHGLVIRNVVRESVQYMYVCMQTFYLIVQYDITVNFPVQNLIFLFESCQKNHHIFFALYCRIKKILRSSRSFFVKLSGIVYL